MTTDTRFPEIEQQFILAGCDGLVAVHAASNIQLSDEQACAGLASLTSTNPTRQQEFIAGRILAQRCLLDLGQQPTPIGCGIDREPLWPDGIVGSITHTSSFAAAVAWPPPTGERPVGIGIDAEHVGRLDPTIWPTVFTIREIARLNQENPSDRDLIATCMFSAKEAIYKAQFLLTRRFIEYDEVAVWMQMPDSQNYRYGPLGIEHEIAELAPFHFSAFYYCLREMVITGAVAVSKLT